MKRTIALILAIISVIAIFPVTAFGAVTNANGSTVSSIAVPTKATGSEAVNAYTVTYTNTDYLPGYAGNAGFIIPVTASNAGMMFLDYEITTLGAYTYVEMYKESTLQTCVASRSISTDEFTGTLELPVPASGTYYLVIFSRSTQYTDPFTNKFTIKPYIISSQNRTMKINKWSAAYSEGNKTYFKFTLSKKAVVTVYSDSTSVSVTLTNKQKKAMQEYSTYLDKDNSYRTSYTLAKGTYYICTTGNYDVYKLKYSTSAIPTLTAKKYKKIYQADDKLNMYVKFKATASGYVTTKTKDYSGYITLCNSSQKAVSTKVYVDSASGDTAVFGVTKGTTYYLRLNNYNDYGSVCFTNTKIADQSGSSKAKAKSMSVGKTYKGYIAASSGTKDWFKVNLSSSKYWAIDIKGATNDTFKISVYKKNGSLVNTYSYYGGNVRLYSYNKDKGTFYVCITRGNAKSSGHYSLKLKTSNSFLG